MADINILWVGLANGSSKRIWGYLENCSDNSPFSNNFGFNHVFWGHIGGRIYFKKLLNNAEFRKNVWQKEHHYVRIPHPYCTQFIKDEFTITLMLKKLKTEG